MLNRKPLEIGLVTLVSTIEECERACIELRNDPLLPNLIGIDAEFVSAAKPYNQWRDRIFESSSIEDDRKGCFARLMQIARVDGSVYLFDLAKFKHWPSAPHDLFTDPSVIRVTHDFKNDLQALKRTFAECGAYNGSLFVDTFEVNYQRSRVSWDTKGKGCKFSLFVSQAFGLELPKGEFQNGQLWNRRASYFRSDMVVYAARDALGLVDLGIYWVVKELWPTSIANRIAVPQELVKLGRPKTFSPLKIIIQNVQDQDQSVNVIYTSDNSQIVATTGQQEDQNVDKTVSNPSQKQEKVILLPKLMQRVRTDLREFRRIWRRVYAPKSIWNQFATDFLATRSTSYRHSCSQHSANMELLLKRFMMMVVNSHQVDRNAAQKDRAAAILGRQPKSLHKTLETIFRQNRANKPDRNMRYKPRQNRSSSSRQKTLNLHRQTNSGQAFCTN